MRVALHAGQLVQPVPGGIGRYVHALARELPLLDVDVTLFAAASRPEELTAPVEWCDLGRPRGPLRYELWHRLRRPTLALAADVVHAPSLAVPPPSGRPLVVTVHDVAFLREPAWFTRRGVSFHRRGLELAQRDAAAIVVPSRFTRDEVIATGADPARVHVIPLAVDVPACPPAEEIVWRLAHAQVTEPYVLTVGTVEPRKNLSRLLDAFAAVRAELPGTSLVVAGRQGWGPPPDVTREGVVRLDGLPDALLEALYRRAAVCCQPSHYEGFGLPALEAMARGVPVVASRIGAFDELVADAGVLVDPDDTDAMATALVRVLRDPGLRAELAARGAVRAATFSWTATARAHADVYAAVA